MASIELKAVRKSFQTLEVLHGVDLKIEDGAFTVFVGPSGCGKSTLLRLMAGLEPISGGEILIDGVRCDHLMPAARGMAMVFQSYALYPHMSVEQNLRFGLENQRLPKDEVVSRVNKAADILQIQHLLKRRPHQLSGGQSQRVAIGRAIVKEPKAFLFDEPLSNLDAELRLKMRSELAALHNRLGATMVYVTHDQVEAMTMADRIVVLRDGQIEQVGSPIDLYTKPANIFVAGFLGMPQMNFLKVSAKGGKDILTSDGQKVSLPKAAQNNSTLLAGVATIGIRPEHLIVNDAGPFKATVVQCEVLGAETIIYATIPSGENLSISTRGILPLARGTPIHLGIDGDNLHFFDASGKRMSV